jgi:thiamine kinase-like enzyme
MNSAAPEDLLVEAAIAQIPAWQGRQVRYQRIQAGITNFNWQLSLDAGQETFFLKLYGAGTELFVDRVASVEAARVAGELQAGPRFVAHLPLQRAEIYEFLSGFRNCSSEDTLHAGTRARVLEAFRNMHSRRLSVTRTGFDQFDERLRVARMNNIALPRDQDYLLWQCARARAAIEASGIDLGICHNDGHVGNFMRNEQGEVRIIDWEYASNNDPYCDLCIFALGSGLDHFSEIIELYQGATSTALEARITLYMGIIGMSWFLWALTQAKLSTLPFDYLKHARIIASFFRHRMRLPSWEEALCRV